MSQISTQYDHNNVLISVPQQYGAKIQWNVINTCKEQDNQSESMKSINSYAAIFNPGVNHKKGSYYEQ